MTGTLIYAWEGPACGNQFYGDLSALLEEPTYNVDSGILS